MKRLTGMRLVLAWLFSFFMVFPVFAASTPLITIYVAKKIITMDPIQKNATAVAVKEGRIYSVGSLDDMKSWMKAGSYKVDEQFSGNVITPGLIEAHCHWSMLVLFLGHPYVGYYNFLGYNAAVLPGAKSKEDVIKHLQAEEKKMTDPKATLFAWGYDPIFLGKDGNLTTRDLDTISKTRSIFVLNASEHIGYVNSALLAKAGIDKSNKVTGVMKNADGTPNGVLLEAEAMEPAIGTFFGELVTPEKLKEGIAGTAGLAQRLGITTVADMLFGGPGEALLVSQLQSATNDPNYPVRVINVYNGILLAMMEKKQQGSGLAHLNSLIKLNTDKLRFGPVKFVSDGSIQGFTARLNWPGYFNGAPNGIFNTPPDELTALAMPFWKAGLPIHVHVNGNQATDSALDTLQALQTAAPSRSNIYVLEHDQMSSPEQFKRARDLGAYVNLFPNHIYYWGDQHYSILLGPDRAARLNDAVEAKRIGLMFSLHTDSPVTPLGQLHSMWAAVNRVTASGMILGPEAKISVEDALRAVTLNAAYLLNLQNEVGSIEVGKRADFTVLGSDPLSVMPETIKDIPVTATIQNGIVHLNQ